MLLLLLLFSHVLLFFGLQYKIMVDNVGSILFETTMVRVLSILLQCVVDVLFFFSFQVLEIAKLMKEYIKEIVTRRR